MFSTFWLEVKVMKESNWDDFPRELKVASNAECCVTGHIFLVFLCSELVLRWFLKWLCAMVEKGLALETLEIAAFQGRKCRPCSPVLGQGRL